LLLYAFLSSLSYAANTPLMDYGPFTISSSIDGFAYIKNQRPETEIFRFPGKKTMIQTPNINGCYLDASVGRWPGLDYIKRNGKAILNVEAVRTNMDQSREF